MAKRVGVLTGGGTAPGWNDAIRGVAKASEEHDIEVMGIEFGFAGLMTPGQMYRNIQEYVRGGIENLRGTRGSVLGSSRDTPFPIKDPDYADPDEAFERKHRAVIEENIARNRLDILIGIGGDDTARSTKKLVRAGVIDGNGVPKTIDNDIAVDEGEVGTLSFGHITAGRVGKETVAGMRAEARAFHKVAVIEAMGRDASWLAALHEDADIVLPAEFEVDRMCFIERIREVFEQHGKEERGNAKWGNAVVVVAEGHRIDGEQTYISEDGEVCPHGHGRLGGIRFRIQQWIKEAGLSPMQIVPGYAYRNGPPVGQDSALAYQLGHAAMTAAAKGDIGMMSVSRGVPPNEDIDVVNIDRVSGGKVLPEEWYDFDQLKPRIPQQPVAVVPKMR